MGSAETFEQLDELLVTLAGSAARCHEVVELGVPSRFVLEFDMAQSPTT